MNVRGTQQGLEPKNSRSSVYGVLNRGAIEHVYAFPGQTGAVWAGG